MFSFVSGTVISINETPDIDFTVPIISRLRHRDTVLRATADPSLLVESLLDLGQSEFYLWAPASLPAPQLNDSRRSSTGDR